MGFSTAAGAGVGLASRARTSSVAGDGEATGVAAGAALALDGVSAPARTAGSADAENVIVMGGMGNEPVLGECRGGTAKVAVRGEVPAGGSAAGGGVVVGTGGGGVCAKNFGISLAAAAGAGV